MYIYALIYRYQSVNLLFPLDFVIQLLATEEKIKIIRNKTKKKSI